MLGRSRRSRPGSALAIGMVWKAEAGLRRSPADGWNGMDLSTGGIILGIFIGLIGVALLNYGRKEVRVPHLVVGFILLVYPFFIPNWIATLAIAAALVGGLAFVTRLGY